MRRAMLTVPPAPGIRPHPDLGQMETGSFGGDDGAGKGWQLDSGADARAVHADRDAIAQRVQHPANAAVRPDHMGQSRIRRRTELVEIPTSAERGPGPRRSSPPADHRAAQSSTRQAAPRAWQRQQRCGDPPGTVARAADSRPGRPRRGRALQPRGPAGGPASHRAKSCPASSAE